MDSRVKKSQKRRDEQGRAYAGSQLQIQLWTNCRESTLSAAVCEVLHLPANSVVKWVSPRPPKFREFKDGAFLRALGLGAWRTTLSQFWPKGGPVWDGLAIIGVPDGTKTYVLVEAKSYPQEVQGSGCQAELGTSSHKLIGESLDATANWLGVNPTREWLGSLYQSANRIAHIYFLRERAGVDARMLNVCFEADPHRATTRDEWTTAHIAFKESLGVDSTSMPWLAELHLQAGTRAELLALAI